MHKWAIPARYFSHPSHNKAFQSVFPKIFRQVSDHKDLFQKEPLDLRCWTKIWATCGAVDVSTYLGILTLEVSIMLEHLSVFTNLSHKLSIFASFTHSTVPLLVFFRIFCYRLRNMSLCAGTLVEGGSVKIDTTLGDIRDSDSSFIFATNLSVLENEWSEIWLSKVFAPIRYRSADTELVHRNDEAKQQLCCRQVTVVVNFKILSLVCFSKILGLMHLLPRNTGCPHFGREASSSPQSGPTNRLACKCAFRTIFLRFPVRGMTNGPTTLWTLFCVRLNFSRNRLQ